MTPPPSAKARHLLNRMARRGGPIPETDEETFAVLASAFPSAEVETLDEIVRLVREDKERNRRAHAARPFLCDRRDDTGERGSP